MNKSNNIISCLSFIFILTAVVGIINADSLSKSADSRANPAKESRVYITVDPRIELIGILQLLCNDQSCTRFQFDYKRMVETHFGQYKEHQAVKQFKKLRSLGLGQDAILWAMLYVSDPPELKFKLSSWRLIKIARNEHKDGWLFLAVGLLKFNRFLDCLRDFVQETSFLDFYNQQRSALESMATKAQMLSDNTAWLDTMEDYFGYSQEGFHIIVSPLLQGGYGPRVWRTENIYDAYVICGPWGVLDDKPVFFLSALNLKFLLWHEFGHSFINPFVLRHNREITQYAALYRPIETQMKKLGYEDWRTCVIEHINRAVTLRLQMLDPDENHATQQIIDNEKQQGFFYMDPLCRKLEAYENNRAVYPTLDAFAPQLVDVFKTLSEKKLGDDFYKIPESPFKGPIISCWYSTPILVLPTHENDPVIQSKIQFVVKSIQHRFFPDALILTDDVALQYNLTTNSVVVYGTLEGNSYLAKHKNQLPFKITSNRITAGTNIYEGVNLRLIMAWPNPDNPNKGLVIYTAQRPEDIININAVFHGPTDYVVAESTNIIRANFFNKQSIPWQINATDK